MLTTQSGIGRR